MTGMKEITFEMQTESAKKIADKLGMPMDTRFEEYLAAIPSLCALIYSENQVEHLAFLMDNLKDEALVIHSRMRTQARMRKVEKL